MMKTRILLLLSAVVLLVHLALVSPNPSHSRSNITGNHLNSIFDLAEKCTKSLVEPCEVFFDNLSGLTEGNNSCSDAFFCKVEQVLNKHKDLCNMNKNEMLRHVKQYNHQRNVMCDKALQGLNITSGVCADRFLADIRSCIQKRNWIEQ